MRFHLSSRQQQWNCCSAVVLLSLNNQEENLFNLLKSIYLCSVSYLHTKIKSYATLVSLYYTKECNMEYWMPYCAQQFSSDYIVTAGSRVVFPKRLSHVLWRSNSIYNIVYNLLMIQHYSRETHKELTRCSRGWIVKKGFNDRSYITMLNQSPVLLQPFTAVLVLSCLV